MRKDLIVPDEKDEILAMPGNEINTRVVTEPFTPLLGRIEKEHPQMLGNLLKLRDLLGAEDFDRYINTLQNIRRNDTTVMLITDRALHKTNIEANILPQIYQAFDVEFVRVVCIG